MIIALPYEVIRRILPPWAKGIMGILVRPPSIDTKKIASVRPTSTTTVEVDGVAERGNQSGYGRYLLALVALGALARLLLMTCVHPYSTSPMLEDSYLQTANDILRLHFRALGDRVPIYPLLVALCGVNPRAVWNVQAILDIAASILIFDMVYRQTRRKPFALTVGLVCSVIPELLLYEFSVLTEILTNFILVTTFWLISRWNDRAECRTSYPLALGTLAAVAGLTRPLMLCLVPVYFCFLVPPWRPRQFVRRGSIRKALAYAAPVVVLVLGWCTFNYFNNGYFTPTIRSGQQLMDQVDPYVYLAPDRFATLRDAWLESRQKFNPSGGLTSEEVYEGVLPLMQRRTGETAAQVSHDLTSLALYMEAHYPAQSLRRAELGWIQFWGQPSSDEFSWPPDGKVRLTAFVMVMTNFLLREIKGAFLLLALLSLPCALLRPGLFAKYEYLLFAVALWISIFAAFTEYGDNRRFCMPLYMLIIYVVSVRAWLWIAPSIASNRSPSDLCRGR
jgi:4-amino-4-deoxy-L-arabinose transferase-like glycosyltransferase